MNNIIRPGNNRRIYIQSNDKRSFVPAPKQENKEQDKPAINQPPPQNNTPIRPNGIIKPNNVIKPQGCGCKSPYNF